MNGSEIPIPLGGIVTIELAARELGTAFGGVDSEIFNEISPKN